MALFLDGVCLVVLNVHESDNKSGSEQKQLS
jgi:hypothetical protein